MTRKLSAIFIVSLLMVAFAVTTSFGMQSADKNKALNRVPINQAPQSRLAGVEAPVEMVSSSKSSAPVSLGYDELNVIPSPGAQVGVTTYDYQHNGRMGRQVDWRGVQIVHFDWMKQLNSDAPGTERRTSYEAYDPFTPGFLQAGNDDSGGCSIHPVNANNISGYNTLDVDTEGKVIIGNHFTDDGDTDNYSPTLWYDFSAGGCYFAPYKSRVPDSLKTYFADPLNEYAYTWPSIEYQVYSGDTVTHVFAQQSKDGINPQYIVYFRRLGSDTVGSWDYPPVMVDTVNDIAQTVTASRTSGKVALVWMMCYPGIPGDPESIQRGGNQRVNDVFYMTSTDMGDTWSGKTNVTQFDSSRAGWLGHTDLSCLIDTQDRLHIIWDAREYGPEGGGVYRHFFGSRLFHWDEYNNIIRTIKDANWDLPTQGCWGGAWNEMSIVKMQIAECNGKFYAMFVQFNDIYNGRSDDCHASNWSANNSSGTANGDIWISVSDNGGLNWDQARNLTDSYTPRCDTIGAAPRCMADMWPSMSRFGMQNDPSSDWTGIPVVTPPGGTAGDWYLDIVYINDKYPGGCVQDAGVWTFNPVKWFRVPCVEPIEAPLLVFSPNAIDDPTWTKPSTPLDTIVRFENIGNAVLQNIVVNIHRLTGTEDWLGVTGAPATISHLIPNYVDVTVNLNKNGAVTTGPHGYDAIIEVVSTSVTSPDTLPVHLIIADTVQFPEWADIRTSCKRITFNNAGNLGNGGYNNYNLNFFDDCDTTQNTNGQNDNARIYLYDASPFVLRVIPGDTVINSYVFNSNWLQNDGYRPIVGLTVDSSNPNYQYAYTGQFLTRDSAIGVESEYWTPLHPDTCSFLVQKVRFVNKTASAINNIRLGELMDWDVPSDSGVENQSARVAGEQMVYIRGFEYAADSIVNNDCILADQRMGGFGYINGYKLPYTGAGDRFGDIAARGGIMTLLNADWGNRTGNFVPSEVWNKTTGYTGYEFWTSTQPTMEDSAAQDLVMIAYFGQFNLGVNDTLIFVKIFATTKTGVSDLTLSLNKAKAWIGGHLNNPPVLNPIGNKSGGLGALTFTATAYDVDGNTLTFSGSNLPSGSSIDPNTGVFNWPTPVEGSYPNVVISVSDGKSTDQETITITIAAGCCDVPGDATNNGLVNVQDITLLINYLYKQPGKPAPACMYEGDPKSDCLINVQDITYLINFLYKQPGKPAPTCKTPPTCVGW